MAESLFLLTGDRHLTRMKPAGFDAEDIFQDLLARFPELLTDDPLGEESPRRWVLVRREAGIPDREEGSSRWSLDHLFLDQDGVPTLVEVKRASDTRSRREVVAQMLDYAANAPSWWRVENLAEWFEDSCERDGTEPGARLSELPQSQNVNREAFWRGVQANLASSRIRMIFVADRIAPELERIVVFLNEQMRRASVLALELAPFSDGADRILAPRIIGLSPRAADEEAVSTKYLSVDEWLSKAKCRDLIERFIAMVEALNGSVQIAGQSLAVDFGPVRPIYICASGRIALSLWLLAKPARSNPMVRDQRSCNVWKSSVFPTVENAQWRADDRATVDHYAGVLGQT
jgi:hypothetical protein